MENQNVKRIIINGKEIILIGTAHVSQESVALVEEVIDEEKPDAICVELCQPRFAAIKKSEKWQDMDIVKVIREKKTHVLLFQLLMASFQKKIAQKLNITPGAEMLVAIKKAEETNTTLSLVDREIRITMLRVWRMMGWWTKAKALSETITSLFYADEISAEEVERLKQRDILEVAVAEVGSKFPLLKTVIIDERDSFLAHKICATEGKRIVAIIGAGHMAGVVAKLGTDIDIDELNRIPPEGAWNKYAGTVFAVLLVGMFVGGFFFSGAQTSINMVMWWSIITAGCASIGAIIMLSHPLTIIASALSAPIATIHPLIATGWVAGMVEASVRKPQVKDFLGLKDDIASLRGFFKNKVTRLLVLIVVVNLTTSVGTLLAIPVVMKLLLKG